MGKDFSRKQNKTKTNPDQPYTIKVIKLMNCVKSHK